MSNAGELNGIPEVLKKLNQYQYSRETDAIFFRGHSKTSYKLRPNIYRDSKIIDNENIISKELLLRCPQDFSHCRSTFEFLVKMQHYSLPTRLLDITTNPLIALYFACKSNQKHDGELITFSLPKEKIKYYDSDTVSVLANISRRPKDFKIPDIESIEEFNNHKDIKYLLHEIRAEKPYFLPLIVPKDISSVICVKPKLDNPRVIRQDSAFFLFGIAKEKNDCATFPEEYVLSKNNRIIIKAKEKSRIINQLEILGITEATVFPEIEKVANYIKTMYSTPA